MKNIAAIATHTGYSVIQSLYLQLLYGCNFRCHHCFQGELLESVEAYSIEMVLRIVDSLKESYSLESICLLGGEPFMFKNLSGLVLELKGRGFRVSVCTNGYNIKNAQLTKVATTIDDLRVSIDGYSDIHDLNRRAGSYLKALECLRAARTLGISTSVTMTVLRGASRNLPRFINDLQSVGVTYLKLHQIRAVGNARDHPEIFPEKEEESLVVRILKEQSEIPVIFDSDLTENPAHCGFSSNTDARVLDRIELQPSGDLYISCKAVGDKSNAFRLDKTTETLLFQPNGNDEISRATEQVVYTGSI